MKIVFILPGWPRKPGGGYRIVYKYANEMASRDHEVTIIHPHNMPNNPVEQKNYCLKLRPKLGRIRNKIFPPHTISWEWIDPRVKLLYVPTIDEKYIPNADAVIATAWRTAEYVEKYSLLKGEKFYLIQHYEIWSGPKERVDATWKSNLHKIVISIWLKELAEKIGAKDVFHIPNAIDHTLFRLIHPIDKRPQRINMMFSETELKGSRDGIKALSIVKKQFPEVSVVFFGVGHRSNKIPSWIEYVRNPAQQYLVEEIYNGSSIYLCPSWTEGWHLPPAEAMSCGCAVVSTDIGGVRDYAINGETSLLSPPHEPEKLAKNIIKLLSNDDIRVRLAKQGRENILKFKWDRSANMLEDFLKRYV